MDMDRCTGASIAYDSLVYEQPVVEGAQRRGDDGAHGGGAHLLLRDQVAVQAGGHARQVQRGGGDAEVPAQEGAEWGAAGRGRGGLGRRKGRAAGACVRGDRVDLVQGEPGARDRKRDRKGGIGQARGCVARGRSRDRHVCMRSQGLDWPRLSRIPCRPPRCHPARFRPHPTRSLQSYTSPNRPTP